MLFRTFIYTCLNKSINHTFLIVAMLEQKRLKFEN